MSFLDQYHNLLFGEPTDIRFHLPYLREVALEYDAPVILECGTRKGNSTIAFMAAIEEKDGLLFSCDIKEHQLGNKMFGKLSGTDKWGFIQADDLALNMNRQFDIIFLDTSHDLYHTVAELRKFYPWVRSGGRILLHDTEWTDIEHVEDSMRMMGSKPGSFGPVAWALDWFCQERKIDWVNHQGSYGLGEIRCL